MVAPNSSHMHRVMQPTITIGITCFNASNTIRRAIVSALQQDWVKTQIIVVDDCSTDGSWRILQVLAKEHDIEIIRHAKNYGVAAARNTLLKHAQGEFIAYFDDDDESYPERLRQQWSRIVEYERDHNCEYVLCTAVRSVAINGKIVHQSSALGQNAPEPSGQIVADHFLGIAQRRRVAWGLFGTCVLMARVAGLRKLGGFDPEFRRCAEWDLAIRAGFRGAHFIAVNEPLIIQHKTQGAEKAGTMPLQYALLLREKHKSYLIKRKAYLGSRAMARAQFHGGKGKYWKARAYAVLAYLSSPSILVQKLERNFFSG